MSTVLVVDDDDDIREMLESALSSEGYAVATAKNGQVALEQLDRMRSEHDAPCLILLDLMMPVMNGAEFLAKLHADPDLAPLAVVVMSAFDRLMQNLPADVTRMKKPVDLAEILAQVARHCRSP